MATWEDPATARLGESLYMFVPRSVVGNLRDGWVAETKRLQSRQLPFFTLQNRCTDSLLTFEVHKQRYHP